MSIAFLLVAVTLVMFFFLNKLIPIVLSLVVGVFVWVRERERQGERERGREATSTRMTHNPPPPSSLSVLYNSYSMSLSLLLSLSPSTRSNWTRSFTEETSAAAFPLNSQRWSSCVYTSPRLSVGCLKPYTTYLVWPSHRKPTSLIRLCV